MIDTYLELSPIILIFILGVILRRTGVVRKDDGGLLLKLVFYIALPALILLSIPDVEVSADLFVLPVSAAIIIFVTFGVASFVLRRFSQDREMTGTAIVGSIIMNTNFLYPFVLILYGTAGFARIVVFDFGNSLLVLTFVYYTACRYGSGSAQSMGPFRRLAASPPLWALAAGLTMNALGADLNPHVRDFLASVGNLVIPLVMLALGIYFSPKLINWRLLLTVLLVRSGGGLVLALGLSALFGLEGLTRSILIICGAAPVGYNTLVFSSLAKLDVEFAASLLSTSIFLALLYVPALMTVLS